MKYAAIDLMRHRYPLSILCDVLSVSTSGYHEWRGRPACARQLANEKLVSEIRVLHAQSFGAYGSPRIHETFKQHGRGIGRTNSAFDAGELHRRTTPQEALPHDGLEPQATCGTEFVAAEL